MESHSQIEDEVAGWLARRDGGRWTQEDEARLQAWLSASTARRVAYLRLKSTWDAAARLRALRAGVSPGAGLDQVPPPDEWRRSPFFENAVPCQLNELGGISGVESTERSERLPARKYSTLRVRFAVAAGLAFVMAGVAAFTHHDWYNRGDRYATAVGGFASVPMADGSKITLNTNSNVRVALTETERRIDLDQGEAFFEVAHDAGRPFVVRAGEKQIVAVGTKFSVQRFDDKVRVLVTEGQVRVEGSDVPAGDGKAHADAVLLGAGEIARVNSSAIVVQKAPPTQVEEFLSWRDGYLRFHETPLADAVAEMNRYNRQKILVADPSLAAMKITGTFRPTQYEAFVRVLGDGFAIDARNEDGQIMLSREP